MRVMILSSAFFDVENKHQNDESHETTKPRLIFWESLDSTPAPLKKEEEKNERKRKTISFYKVGIPHWKNKAIKYQPILPPGPKGKKENTCTIHWEIRWTKIQGRPMLAIDD